MATGTSVRVCSNCEHAAFGTGGTWCTLFREEIWREAEVANECPEFVSVPWASEDAKGATSE